MIVKFDSVAKGVNTDAMPEELGDGAWSSCLNVRFRGGHLERAPGMAQIFDLPSITPYFVAPFRTAAGLLWVHAGLAKAFVDDGSVRTEIGRVSAYTGGTSDRWTGGAFNGVFILSNGVDVPQFWNGNVATRFADLTNWPATTRCRALRPFRNVLVAMDITRSGTRFPFRVMWSAIADPGAVPPGWDITAADGREAGELDVAAAAGPIIDALPLGDELMIYTSASTHVMRFVGGSKVFAITPVFGGVGALGRNCIAQTPLGHVVLTTGDVMLQGSGAPRSIADGVVRRRIFETLDNSSAEKAAFVVTNPADNEAWVCYPTDGSATCTLAAVWNWLENTWSFRELRNVTAGATGQTPLAVGPRWSTVTGTWADTTLDWGGSFAGVNDQHLVLSHALPALSLVGYGLQDLGVTTQATAERIGMRMGDAQRVKTCRGIWPRIDAKAGTVVSVQLGAAMSPDVAPTWATAVPFTVGTSAKVDSFVTGRYLALRLSGSDAWRLRGLDMDVVPRGRF